MKQALATILYICVDKCGNPDLDNLWMRLRNLEFATVHGDPEEVFITRSNMMYFEYRLSVD